MTAADYDRLEAFLSRSATIGFSSDTASILGDNCSERDDKLINNEDHLESDSSSVSIIATMT